MKTRKQAEEIVQRITAIISHDNYPLQHSTHKEDMNQAIRLLNQHAIDTLEEIRSEVVIKMEDSSKEAFARRRFCRELSNIKNQLFHQ